MVIVSATEPEQAPRFVVARFDPNVPSAMVPYAFRKYGGANSTPFRRPAIHRSP
jgi:hypothetical protein